MCRTITLFLVLACVAACNSGSAPELALHAYIRAVEDGRCEDARKLLSARTNHALDVLRDKPQHPQNPLPLEEYYCRQLLFENCKSQKMTLTEQRADTATVSMPCGRTQDSIFPGFSSAFLKYEPRDTEMIREDGAWHVVMPFVIRVAEIRETEDKMRDAELRRMEDMKRKRGKPPALTGRESPQPPVAPTPL